MTFNVEASRFAAAESGTDSFKLLYKAAFVLMTQQPADAAFFFVIGVAAHNYVLKYEDQGVSPESADKAKAVMVGFNKKIAQALASAPDVGIKLLGEVSADYQFHVQEF